MEQFCDFPGLKMERSQFFAPATSQYTELLFNICSVHPGSWTRSLKWSGHHSDVAVMSCHNSVRSQMPETSPLYHREQVVITSGQGSPRSVVLRATSKHCSRFTPKLLTQGESRDVLPQVHNSSQSSALL